MYVGSFGYEPWHSYTSAIDGWYWFINTTSDIARDRGVI